MNDRSIGCLLQDSKGFIWFGGEHGLYRFDGYDLVYYKDPPGCKNCPPFYPVYDMVEDNQGMLWTISYKGIILYDPENEKSWVIYRSKSFSTHVYDIKTLDLMKDSRGNIWATNDYGLIRFSFKENFNNKIIGFDKDPKRNLSIDFFQLSQNKDYTENHALKIYEDSEGNIWTGCFDGLYVMRKGDTSFYRLETGANLNCFALNDILQLNKDTIFILCSYFRISI